jgi:hypothetical protein
MWVLSAAWKTPAMPKMEIASGPSHPAAAADRGRPATKHAPAAFAVFEPAAFVTTGAVMIAAATIALTTGFVPEAVVVLPPGAVPAPVNLERAWRAHHKHPASHRQQSNDGASRP